MTLIPIVTKKSATMSRSGLYTVTANLKLMDGETVLIDRDFSENYWSGQDSTISSAKMQEQMQEVINTYKAEQVIFNAPEVDEAIIMIQSKLEV